MTRIIAHARLLLTAALFIAGSALAQDDASVTVAIDAKQPLGEALQSFADQSGLQVVFFSDVTDGIESKKLDGDYTTSEALDTLLADTGLTYTFLDEKSVSVQPVSSTEVENSEPGKSQPASSQVLMAQNQTSATRTQTNGPTSATEEGDEASIEIEEIIVVGSHIRGVKNSASPVFTFDRADIEASGYATVNQFVQTIPQNFGGGPNENSAIGTSPVAGGSGPGQGTGINLRGLGARSTLTLVNGHRVAPAGAVSYTDVASIPTSAIQRIDVLTDGASAIYGSDAVGGVVNIILRDDYEGAETLVRYGTVTDGDHEEVKVAQTVGKNWGSGNVVATYEYYDRSNLDAQDRNFGGNAPEPQDLLPDVERHSVFMAARQDLNERVELSGQGYYNKRTSKQFSGFQTSPRFTDDDVTEYGGTGVLQFEITDEWYAKLSGTYGQNKLDAENFLVSDGSLAIGQRLDQSTWTLDGVVDGPLINSPGGDVSVALGGHYREEELGDLQLIQPSGPTTAPGVDRDVLAVFGEVFVPLMGESNAKSAAARLEFTAALRYEDYSDFGSTTNPRFGLLWSPADSVIFRGTWGTSFRAPLLRQINPSTVNAFIFSLPDPVLGATVPVLFTSANFNSNLQPEEATTWTAGFDIMPSAAPDLKISITFFDIDYTDRIEFPFDSQPFSALNPEFVSLVPRDPTLSVVQSFVDQATAVFFDATDMALLASVRAIVDFRPINVADVQIRGFDFSIDYGTETTIGELNLALSGTYMTDWDKRIAQDAPIMSELNTVFAPTDIKLRASADWSRGGATTAFFVNYIGSSVNDRIVTEPAIDSWTTVDFNFQYDTTDRANGGIADNTKFSFSVTNLLDENPPFVENPSTGQGTGVNFDGTNANALGRFVSFQITKQW